MLPLVSCRPSDISQAILNLVVNAAQAIGEQAPNDPGRIQVSISLVDGYAKIVVQDNRCGIPSNMIKWVFDPFFTTKEVGQGTGQGLAIYLAIIIQKHHGSIECASTLGEGTSFKIRLPLAIDANQQDKAA
ncbi:MAG: ATP-binding protein [Candidatus Devosia symbiotica]|nr:ATP-binding protein [Candidatus Devosia symbiotica]